MEGTNSPSELTEKPTKGRITGAWAIFSYRSIYQKIEQIEKENAKDENREYRIYKSTNNFIFLGRDKDGKYAKYRIMRRRINKKYKLYNSKIITFKSLVDSVVSYKYVSKRLDINK